MDESEGRAPERNRLSNCEDRETRRSGEFSTALPVLPTGQPECPDSRIELDIFVVQNSRRLRTYDCTFRILVGGFFFSYTR